MEIHHVGGLRCSQKPEFIHKNPSVKEKLHSHEFFCQRGPEATKPTQTYANVLDHPRELIGIHVDYRM